MFIISLFFCVCLCSIEEILQTHKAHWWSPDGLRLAYMTINDTLVPKMEVPFFTGTPYPNSLEYHYPKASPPPPSRTAQKIKIPCHVDVSVELLNPGKKNNSIWCLG